VRIASLGSESFVAHNVPSPLRRQVVETFERHGTPLNISVELPTIEAVKRFVAMGNGVALAPALAVARELELGELVRIGVPELRVERHLRLVHRRRAVLSYAAVAFLKAARTFAAEQRAPYRFQVERGATEASKAVENTRAAAE
jgi:DNA-binding transcriptional LysR family regulator